VLRDGSFILANTPQGELDEPERFFQFWKVSLNVDLFEKAVGTEQLMPVQKIKTN